MNPYANLPLLITYDLRSCHEVRFKPPGTTNHRRINNQYYLHHGSEVYTNILNPGKTELSSSPIFPPCVEGSHGLGGNRALHLHNLNSRKVPNTYISLELFFKFLFPVG
jgi:hypothetical protein